MKYFKLGQDQRVPYAVLLTGVTKIGGYYESKGGDLTTLAKAFLSLVYPSPVNFYPDILDKQIFMVKGAVKEVFDLFSPELEYKYCVMLDHPLKKETLYEIPILDVMDMKEGIKKEKHIFRIAGTKEITVAASLAVVEAIWRRKPAGIRIRPVELD